MHHSLFRVDMKFWTVFVLILLPSLSLSKPAPTVLLLNSYHTQYPWTKQLTDGVVDALSNKIPSENVHVEHMDSRRFADGPSFQKKLKSLLTYKYKHYKPDVVITSDDFAYNFMLANRDELFPDVPIVFCGVNVFDQVAFEQHDGITGILEGMEIEGNLKLIKRIQPSVNKVILLGDTSGLGLSMTNYAKVIKKSWTDPSLELEVWDTFSFEELHERVKTLPSTSAILMLAIHNDRSGRYFSYTSDLPKLTRVSSAPVYGMWGGVMLGNGAIGGLMNDPYDHGYEAGSIALEVLSGKNASEIAVQPKARFKPEFDYNVLKKFNINLSLLPENSYFINKPVNVYETYKHEINVVIIFVIMLVIIIGGLLFYIRKRLEFEKQLDNLNKNLELKIKFRTKEVNFRNQELEQAHQRMKELANTDVLTGLCNRRAAQKEVSTYIERAKFDGDPLCAALLDIDFFKQINDQYGHQVGDNVLVDFAQELRQAIRPSDRVYRWGGEEFLILLPNTPLTFSLNVCERILKNIESRQFKQAGKVTASVGIADLKDADNIDTLVQRADECLYKAKENGRNQVVTS